MAELTEAQRRLLVLIAHHDPPIRSFRELGTAARRPWRTVYGQAQRLAAMGLVTWEHGTSTRLGTGRDNTLRLQDRVVVSLQGRVVGRLLWSNP